MYAETRHQISAHLRTNPQTLAEIGTTIPVADKIAELLDALDTYRRSIPAEIECLVDELARLVAPQGMGEDPANDTTVLRADFEQIHADLIDRAADPERRTMTLVFAGINPNAEPQAAAEAARLRAAAWSDARARAGHRFLNRALGGAQVRFWVCPVEPHRDRRGVTVEWVDNVAYCTAKDCIETSAAA